MIRASGGVFVVALAAGLALAPIDPRLVEKWFSTSVYPLVQRVMTQATNIVPFAVLDLLIIAVTTACLVLVARAVRRSRATGSFRPIAAAGWRLLVIGCSLYVAFLLFWGLNYRRVGMQSRIDLRDGTADTAAVRALGDRAVAELNRLHADAHRAGWTEDPRDQASLRGAFLRTQQMLTGAPPAVPGRLKWSMLGPFFRWSSVDGMVNPFGLEVLGNPDLLPWERPFVAAHEWAHLAGFAHEDEASFVGWVACMQADVPARYSGWLFLYWQIGGELPAAQGEALASALAAGPRSDVEAIVERLRRGQLPRLRRVSWRVYDSYLKANRVDEGVRSYGEALTLILRARLDDAGLPVRLTDPTDP